MAIGRRRVRLPTADVGYAGGMMALLLLAACDPAPKPGTAGDPADTADAVDTAAADTAETGDPGDSGDTADSGDTGPAPDDGPPAWTGTFFDAPDLRIASCGSSDGELVVAVGPDLDGDGLSEVAVGSPDADGDAYGEGRVYVLDGADVVAGTVDLFAPMATLRPPGPSLRGALGTRLRWVGDRDGDGVDDLYVAGFWLASGADLLAGGEFSPRGVSMGGVLGLPRRWDDLDGDGLEDWVLGDPSMEPDHVSGGGAVFVALDADFGSAGVANYAFEVHGDTVGLGLGADVVPLDVDLDGDGIRELLATQAGGAAILGSAAILAGEATASGATLGTVGGVDISDDVTVLGDVDGDGIDDLAFLASGRLCTLAGADVAAGTVEASCDATTIPDLLAAAGDVDGDGDLDVWVAEGAAVSAVDAGDLLSGAWTVVRTLPERDDDVEALETADAGVWVGVTTSGWTPDEAIWRFDDDGALSTTLLAGGWGGEPEAPAVRDVDHDGLDDLVFSTWPSKRVYVVTGAQLAAGGELSLCDAAYTFVHDGDTATFLDDVDGDGVDEVVVASWWAEDDGNAYAVLDGASMLSTGVAVERARLVARPLVATGCRALPDGAEPVVTGEGDGLVVYRPELLAGVDADVARVGAIDARTFSGCAPDLDGDGLEELLVPWQGYDGLAVVFAASLDPDVVVDPSEAAVVLFPGEESTVTPLFAGTLGLDPVWGFLQGNRVGWYTLPALPVASEDDLGAYTTPGWDYTGADAAWLDDAVGGPEPDLVAHIADGDWNRGFYALDGTDLRGEKQLLVATVPHENDLWDWEGGQGPDVLGAGASSLWLVYRTDDAMRWTLELVVARGQ